MVLKNNNYFSNLINKITTKPTASNAKPRRLHIPITDINSNVGGLSTPALIFRNQQAVDINTNPIMNVNIPNPSIIFFLFILSPSLVCYNLLSLNIFVDFFNWF